jgi:HSP20 family protein
MNSLVNVPKSGSLTNNTSKVNFPVWSNLFDEILNRDLPSLLSSNFNTGITLPKVNIRETADSFLVEMAVPGLKKSDFHIELDNRVLSISTAVEDEQEHKEENYTRREFGYSSFKRSFTLPESVNDEEINATYNHGILNILLPKKEEAKQRPARSIKIS